MALVGRSNVGKSSLINALARARIARTSAAPGKTRLANVYRLRAGRARPWHLVDLPGYGYARGGAHAASAFERLTTEYFEWARPEAALLVVDSRHPGLERDLAAWRWLGQLDRRAAVVATKIDKLSRAERARNLQIVENVFGTAAVPVSVTSGEGLDELWTLIARIARDVEPRG